MPRGQNAALEIYLQLQFPWDAVNKDLWKCVSWKWQPPGQPDPAFANYGAQSYDDLIRLVETRAARNTDVYLGLGALRMASQDKFATDGFPKVSRKANNVASHNSIYLDVDVKAGAYATTQDARNALYDFCDQCGMPDPSMEVLSGSGGIHVYWCTHEPMPLANWSPLALGLRDAAVGYGLKFDPQCTVDAARILRAPNTWNHKTNPPKPVELLPDSSFRKYGYQELVTALGSYVGILPGVRAMRPTTYTQNFTEGVSTSPPVTIDDVAVNCGVVNDILDREGAGDSEPLWNQALYAASFTTDPHDAAHRLSRGHTKYDHASTEKKLLEKIQARAADPSRGWPTCQSFHQYKPGICSVCPFYAQGKSPLNFARRPQPATQFVPASDPLMPEGYFRDHNLHVRTTIVDKDKTYDIDLLGYPILDAGIDMREGLTKGQLVFKTVIGGVEQWCHAPISSSMETTRSAQAMAGGVRGDGIYINPDNHKLARKFLVTWMTHLQKSKKYINAVSYGWTDDQKGFTYDNLTYTENGSQLAFRGSTLDKRFSAVGELKPWQDAAQLVYGNPPLETVVASAFASPLVELLGPSSVVLSVYSHLSGVGKTTAMMLAQSVWGNPRTGMSTLDDTTNSVMKKVADCRSLPNYWDELRTTDQLEKVIQLVFSITGGKGKSRLNKDITQAEAGSFTTMFVIASNYGIADTVYSLTDGTEAGGLRVFELEVNPLISDLPDWKARQILKEIEINYGVPGTTFAEFLGKNRKTIKQMLAVMSEHLQLRYKFETKERFWNVAMSALLVGAKLANHCGLTKFDLVAMDKYLDDMFHRQRRILTAQSYSTLSTPEDGLTLLQDLLMELKGKHLLLSETIHYGQGKPPPIAPVEIAILDKLTDVWAQYGVKDGRLRLQQRKFDQWLRDRRIQPRMVKALLGKFYYVNEGRATIGAGVQGFDIFSMMVGSGRSQCYEFTPRPTFHGSILGGT